MSALLGVGLVLGVIWPLGNEFAFALSATGPTTYAFMAAIHG